jgi:hypothetical protein
MHVSWCMHETNETTRESEHRLVCLCLVVRSGATSATKAPRISSGPRPGRVVIHPCTLWAVGSLKFSRPLCIFLSFVSSLSKKKNIFFLDQKKNVKLERQYHVPRQLTEKEERHDMRPWTPCTHMAYGRRSIAHDIDYCSGALSCGRIQAAS